MNELLRRASLFAALDDEDAASLAASMTELVLTRGGVLFREGQPGDRLYVVAEGKIKLGQTFRDGRENLLGVFGPGATFGEVSLFDPGPRTATATAITETRVLALRHHELAPLLQRRPDVAFEVLGELTRRLRRGNEAISDLVFFDLPVRLANALLDLGQRFGVESEEGVYVALDLNQTELAHLVGTTRESINKVLAVFASRGWLRVQPPRAVVLIDMGAAPLEGLSGVADRGRGRGLVAQAVSPAG